MVVGRYGGQQLVSPGTVLGVLQFLRSEAWMGAASAPWCVARPPVAPPRPTRSTSQRSTRLPPMGLNEMLWGLFTLFGWWEMLQHMLLRLHFMRGVALSVMSMVL